jgi:hypothetical protein
MHSARKEEASAAFFGGNLGRICHERTAPALSVAPPAMLVMLRLAGSALKALDQP